MKIAHSPFRQLLEIEKIDWTHYKKLLLTKKDKKSFDKLFENAIGFTRLIYPML